MFWGVSMVTMSSHTGTVSDTRASSGLERDEGGSGPSSSLGPPSDEDVCRPAETFGPLRRPLKCPQQDVWSASPAGLLVGGPGEVRPDLCGTGFGFWVLRPACLPLDARPLPFPWLALADLEAARAASVAAAAEPSGSAGAGPETTAHTLTCLCLFSPPA